MDRRTFLSCVGLGAIATSLPIALAACSDPGSTSSSASESAATNGVDPGAAAGDFVTVGTVAELEGSGSITVKDFSGSSGDLVVFKANDQVIALDSYCNHNGCSSAWDGEQLVCPCHNSRFSPDGSLISGPATKGLTVFEAKVEGEQILVKAG